MPKSPDQPNKGLSISKEKFEEALRSGEAKILPNEEVKPSPRRSPEFLDPLVSQALNHHETVTKPFFGDQYGSLFPETIPIPEIPSNIREYIEKGELRLYYLPNIKFPDITKDTDIDRYIESLQSSYPNWTLPNKTLFDLVKTYITSKGKEGISPSSLNIKSGWIFIETAQKPVYDQGNQTYPITQFQTDLSALIKQSDPDLGTSLSTGKRSSITYDDIQSKIIPKAKELNPSLSLPTILQYNLLANLEVYQTTHAKPDPKSGWGSTNTWEWLDDERKIKKGVASRLLSGDSDSGGLSSVDFDHPGHRFSHFGFRLFGGVS